jgi:hypothetical protein
MKKHTITVEIDAAGVLSVDAEGFSGDACVRDVQRLLEELATRPHEVQRKRPDGAVSATVRAGSTVKVGGER